MIYLLLAVFCSASIGGIFKISDQQKTNKFVVTTVNYLTAVVVSGLLLVNSNIGWFPSAVDFGRLLESWMNLDTLNNAKLSYEVSYPVTILLGIVTGWIYFAAFIYYQVSVKNNGISLSGMFSRLGILLPMSISIFLWNEIPTKLQTMGILLCLFSIVMVNFSFKKGENFQINRSLILLFLFFGLAIFFNKIFQKYLVLELKPLFLFSVFTSAALISLSYSIKHLRTMRKRELVIGIAVGIPNLATAWFLIQALDEIKASIVFPVFSASTIILMTILAFLFFQERLKSKDAVAVMLTAFALVLINL